MLDKLNRIYNLARKIPLHVGRHAVVIVDNRDEVYDLLSLFESSGFYINRNRNTVSLGCKGSIFVTTAETETWRYMQISDVIFSNDTDIETKHLILSRNRSTLFDDPNFYMY